MSDVAQEAMEALLVLHHPDKIKAWNPEATMNTFWDVSSQVLFSISQKLIQHQIVNYTDILKWLREILICRNIFLSQNKDYANVGSQIAICKQAHIKLEVNNINETNTEKKFMHFNFILNLSILGCFLHVSLEYRHGSGISSNVVFRAAL